MNADFVRTARSKGMSERQVVHWHLARNALVIVLTTIGLQFGTRHRPGGGRREAVRLAGPRIAARRQRQRCATSRSSRAAILVIVLFFLLVNTLVDVLCAMIDPRIKYT